MRLLIAEDDKALSLFLGRGLESEGHRVHTVHDGARAVEAFRDESPDLTILDLNLPVMDGEVALAEMRQLNTDLPVLVLTASGDEGNTRAAFEAGATDYLTKPFTIPQLMTRVTTCFARAV